MYRQKIDNKKAYAVLGLFTLIFAFFLGLDKGPGGQAYERIIGGYFNIALNFNETPVENTNGGGPCIDSDGDGFAGSGGNCGLIDFDDSDKFKFPNAPEWCDGKDNNNDGRVDYLNVPGDFCSTKDCYGKICTLSLTWKALGVADYPTLNKFDMVLTNGQNVNKAGNITGRMITHRSIVEASNHPATYYGWDVINSHEDWYMHNGGSRMQSQGYAALWLMDMNQSGYRDFMANQAGDIVVYSELDGYFYDNFVDLDGHASYVSGNYNGFNVRNEYTSYAVFDSLMQDVAYRMKRAIGNKLIFANNNGLWYRGYFDGYMAENWIHNSNVDGWPAGWYPESKWLQDMALATNAANNNKILILECMNSVPNPTVFNFCFASYLLAKQPSIATHFGFYTSAEVDPVYYSAYDVDLGAPTGNYQQVMNGLYVRDFAKGKVLVNPKDDGTVITNYDLGGLYQDLQGNQGTTITLAGHRGAVLIRVGDGTPPPVCGNNIREQGEQCDGTDLGGLSCSSWGFVGGTLTCTPSCVLNTTQCISETPAVCGNGTIEPGEQCDGSNFGSQSCTSLGFLSGSLLCSSSCQIQTTQCLSNSGGAGGLGGDLTGSGDEEVSTSTPDLPPDEQEEEQPLVPTDQTRGRLLAVLGRKGSAVYWIGNDGKKYVFPDQKTYLTWFEDFDNVDYVPAAELDNYPDGGVVTYRPGTNLVTHQDTARIYAVSPGGVLHWIKDVNTAVRLYGTDWASRVRDVIPGFFSTSYSIGDPIGTVYGDGTLIQKGPDIFYMEDGKKRRFTSIEAFFTNGLNTDFIVLVNDVSIFENGADITGFETDIARLASQQ